MTVAVALFTRDLRVHDNPTLQAALNGGDLIVPLFVLDETILASPYNAPNRAHFLVGALRDLDSALKRLGGDGLVVRRGEAAAQVAEVAADVDADAVHVSGDYSLYAKQRERRLRERLRSQGCRLHVHAGSLAVVPPGTVLPSGRGKDHFSVFTPYHRSWERETLRPVLAAPKRVTQPRVRKGHLPKARDICSGDPAPRLPEPGERAGRRRIDAWLDSSVRQYDAHQDNLSGDETSRISPYLHFGCLSPVEVVAHAGRSQGAESFVRQLAWRDFHLQVLAARPSASHRDYRPRADRWRRAGGDLQAWRDGRTGVPIVDAAMRQLLHEGWMHNRARLIVGSFLTKHLYIDWRDGAAHFLAHLVDGDIANNQLNWQWVAGTGTDTRPNRVLNPLRQAERFDPDGAFVRRHLPELAEVAGNAVHEPWKLPRELRRTLDYPEPLVDLDAARRRFLDARETS